MNLAIPCARCGRIFEVSERFSGRKIRCQTCGKIQRVPRFPTSKTGQQAAAYPLVPELPEIPRVAKPQTGNLARDPAFSRPGRYRNIPWRGLLRASAAEASVLELEILALIALSTADVLVTYILLRRGPAFYESNPVAHWFFLRWNIAGMAVFKFSAMGLVIVIGEIVERHRRGWGRALLAVSCLATAAVVWYGLRLVFGHADDGAPLQ
jgi:DNA-directed RNA polymerase subunit RPC12/RpoP